MQFAVFFRNLNLGRPPAPTKAALEQCFLDAGASTPASFLTNGNLVFEASSPTKAAKIVATVQKDLQKQTGFSEPAFMRELAYLKALVQQEPFSHIDREKVYEFCVTFFDTAIKLGSAPAQANTKGDVQVIRYTAGEMLSLSYKLSASPGSPNAFAEREFGTRASTRSWSTVSRLVKKFDVVGE